ncbi:MAG: 16S rRNA pseudouridine(516) synthase, partial [Candidatus Competibacteraceae bacterium]|nr:16S rRNA pseudouridine(516) synthase [Candidatus Competibacteraceae bacterium]
MRLDKYLSQATGISRSQVRKLIRDGEASVDGEVVKNAAFNLAEGARVSLTG